MQNFGVGVSTTCGYMILGHSDVRIEGKTVLSYFIMNGLRTYVLLSSNLFHNFNAYSYSHQTSVPIIIKDNMVHYNDKDICILAWGGSGTKN